MSQSPIDDEKLDPNEVYLDAWGELSRRIQQGQSFSGRERNCFFLNTGGPKFADASSVVGLDQIDDSRAVALTDWDQDGDLDLWQTNRTGPRVRFLRNDASVAHDYVALRLRGAPQRGVSRDAIGARVKITTTSPDGKILQQHRTVVAGDGFLSQSSKQIHFGMPAGSKIEAVEIRWPGAEEFVTIDAVRTRRRYVVEQGKGAREQTSPRESLAIAAANQEPTAPDQRHATGGEGDADNAMARLWLTVPRALDDNTYTELPSGGELRFPPGRPRLVLLWATWCAPCLEELALLNAQWERLAGRVAINALSIEAINADAPTQEKPNESVSDFANRLDLKFPYGLASEAMIEAIDKARQEALYRQERLPLPSSILLDANGMIRAFYAGPLDITRLEADLRQLAAPTDETTQQDFAVPFAGRWSDSQFTTNPIAVANVYREERQFDDAYEYLKRYLDQQPTASPSSADPRTRRQLADVYHLMGRIESGRGRVAESIVANELSLAYYDKNLLARLELADHYTSQANYRKAVEHLRQAEKLSGNDARVTNKFGLVALGLNRPDEAIKLFERAIGQNRRYLPPANNLAWLLATHPQSDVRDGAKAVKLATAIVAQAGERAELLDTLATAQAAAGDFAAAVKTAQRAVQIARETDSPLEAEIQVRLELFRSKRPYVEDKR